MAPATVKPSAFSVEGQDGVAINVWDYGGGGPPLVLCHCTGTHARVWDPLVPAFLDAFHVYAPDTRGHGDSAKPADPEAYAWAKSGADTLRVMEAVAGGEPVYAAGHSAGAAHIVYAALERPALIARAVLIDAIVGPAEFFAGESPLAAAARRRRHTFDSFEEARERFGSKPPLGDWAPEVLDAYVTHGLAAGDGTVSLKCPGTIEAHVYDRGGATDAFERLGELAIPVKLVTAEHSNVRYLAERQRERLPNAPFTVVAGASHFIPQERPAETARLIREFLAQSA